MFDPGNIWDGNHLSQSFLFENVNDVIARADEQMIRTFHSQCFAVGCVDRERLKWLSLLQLADFICNHQSRLIFSAVTDKTTTETRLLQRRSLTVDRVLLLNNFG